MEFMIINNETKLYFCMGDINDFTTRINLIAFDITEANVVTVLPPLSILDIKQFHLLRLKCSKSSIRAFGIFKKFIQIFKKR